MDLLSDQAREAGLVYTDATRVYKRVHLMVKGSIAAKAKGPSFGFE
jgi:hypothetical protein